MYLYSCPRVRKNVYSKYSVIFFTFLSSSLFPQLQRAGLGCSPNFPLSPYVKHVFPQGFTYERQGTLLCHSLFLKFLTPDFPQYLRLSFKTSHSITLTSPVHMPFLVFLSKNLLIKSSAYFLPH